MQVTPWRGSRRARAIYGTLRVPAPIFVSELFHLVWEHGRTRDGDVKKPRSARKHGVHQNTGLPLLLSLQTTSDLQINLVEFTRAMKPRRKANKLMLAFILLIFSLFCIRHIREKSSIKRRTVQENESRGPARMQFRGCSNITRLSPHSKLVRDRFSATLIEGKRVSETAVVRLETGDLVTSEGRVLVNAVDPVYLVRSPATKGRLVYEFSREELCKLDLQVAGIVKPIPRNPSLLGILVTKDDGQILCEFAFYVLRHFDAVVVIDGSVSSLAREVLQRVPNVIYLHEDQLGLLDYTDGEMRKRGHEEIIRRYGQKGQWIHMLHTDEFPIHNIRTVTAAAERTGADTIKWQALHVLPHPTEFPKFMRCGQGLVHNLFRHYHYMDNSKGGFQEYRTFRNFKGSAFRGEWCETVPKFGLRKTWSPRMQPAYLHYKLWNLTLSTYTPDGRSRRAFNRVSKKAYQEKGVPVEKQGTGIRFNVSKIEDFFHEAWPHCCKYKAVGIYHGKIDRRIDISTFIPEVKPNLELNA